MKVNGKTSVLIACEQSQVVCSAFRKVGIAAFSNDIQPCCGGHPEWHIIGDAVRVVQGNGTFGLEDGREVRVIGNWGIVIAHPPCTMLTHRSAVALSKGIHTIEDVSRAAFFFRLMLNAPANMVAVEDPAPMKFIGLPPCDQIVNPWQFGHPFSKRCCLWLRNLPPLIPMRGSCAKHIKWNAHCSSSSRRRSKTFEGIAEAMAWQWGALLDLDF